VRNLKLKKAVVHWGWHDGVIRFMQGIDFHFVDDEGAESEINIGIQSSDLAQQSTIPDGASLRPNEVLIAPEFALVYS